MEEGAGAADGVPAYVVFHDRTLQRLRDGVWGACSAVGGPGVGPAKLERHGDDLLATLARA